MRQRAPVSSRASAEPRSWRTSTRNVATTSTTSGVVSRPPSPTISTGRPSACSASASSGICERRRTSTAAVRSPGASASHAARIRAATQRASVSTVSSAGDGQRARPGCRRRAAVRPRRRPTAAARRPRSRRPGSAGRCGSWSPAGTGSPGARPASAKVVGEPADVAGAGSAPAVDRLQRVADRRHRMSLAEQAGQRLDLSVTGVLVLVEQHGREPLALGLLHLGHAATARRPRASGRRSRRRAAQPSRRCEVLHQRQQGERGARAR